MTDKREYKHMYITGSHCLLPKGVQDKIRQKVKDPREQASLIQMYHAIYTACVRAQDEPTDNFTESATKSWDLDVDNETAAKHRYQLEDMGLIEVDWGNYSWKPEAELAEGERNHAYGYKLADFDETEMELTYIGRLLVESVKRQPYFRKDSVEKASRSFLQGLKINDDKMMANLAAAGPRRASAAQKGVLKLRKKHYGVSRDDTVNRLHHILTNSSKIIRPALTYGKQEIVAFDLCEAHPTFIANMVGDEKLLDTITESERGFYWELADAMGYETRDEVKPRFMCYLYDQNRDPKTSRMTKYMLANYPETANYVWQHKKENGANMFPIEMMRYESNLFIDGAYSTAIMEQIPALTIHDSLLSSEEHADQIEAILRDQLDSEGIRYKLAEEHWQ